MIKTIFRLMSNGDSHLVPIVISAQWDRVKNFFLRYVYAHHNARVIIDFENRMSSVIYAATGGMMSKSYYTEEVMLDQIREFQNREMDEWYAEGRKDAFEEMGEDDPLLEETNHADEQSGTD